MVLRIFTFISILVFSLQTTIAQNNFVSWGYSQGVEIDYGVIEKISASDTWGSAGAVSLNVLLSGKSGVVTYPVSPTGEAFALGIFPTNSVYDYTMTSMDFAVRVSTANEINLFKSGVFLASFGKVKAGDILGFEVANSRFYLIRNGVRLSYGYQMSAVDYSPVISIRTPGKRVEFIKSDFDNLYLVDWEKSTGLDVALNGWLNKSNGTNVWGESAAFSSNILSSGQNGYAQFKYYSSNGSLAFGLISDSVDLGYLSMNYCYLVESSKLMVVVDGRVLTTYSPLKGNDVLKIERSGDRMTFFVNTMQIYSLAVDEGEGLEIKGALKNIGTVIPNPLTTFKLKELFTKSYVRLVNADDPGKIPFTRVHKNNGLGIIYKEEYAASSHVKIKIFDSSYNELTGDYLVYNPTEVVVGENKFDLAISNLTVNEEYHLEVIDGMNRKWQMNFYIID